MNLISVGTIALIGSLSLAVAPAAHAAPPPDCTSSTCDEGDVHGPFSFDQSPVVIYVCYVKDACKI